VRFFDAIQRRWIRWRDSQRVDAYVQRKFVNEDVMELSQGAITFGVKLKLMGIGCARRSACVKLGDNKRG
jgi:hypothetical protein